MDKKSVMSQATIDLRIRSIQDDLDELGEWVSAWDEANESERVMIESFWGQNLYDSLPVMARSPKSPEQVVRFNRLVTDLIAALPQLRVLGFDIQQSVLENYLEHSPLPA